jgi:hypothetical protein
MLIRYYLDEDSGQPHIYNHGVREYEVEEVFERPAEDRRGREDSRIVIGQTVEGRYIRVIYVPDPEPGSVFVITALPLEGKPLTAYKRRKRRRS